MLNHPISAADDWNSHWSNFNEVTAINPAQRWRFRSIERIIKSFGLGHQMTVTDLGCGQGDLLSYLHDQFPESVLTGIEPSEVGCHLSRLKTPNANILQIDITSCRDANSLIKASDVVVCTEVLEHLDRPELLMSSLAQLMSPNSTLLISVPGGPRSKFNKHIGHRRHFDKKSLEELLKDSGFNLYKISTIVLGKKLIKTAASADSNPVVRCISQILFKLISFSKHRSRFGWQLFAVCKI